MHNFEFIVGDVIISVSNTKYLILDRKSEYSYYYKLQSVVLKDTKWIHAESVHSICTLYSRTKAAQVLYGQ